MDSLVKRFNQRMQEMRAAGVRYQTVACAFIAACNNAHVKGDIHAQFSPSIGFEVVTSFKYIKGTIRHHNEHIDKKKTEIVIYICYNCLIRVISEVLPMKVNGSLAGLHQYHWTIKMY